MKYTALSIAFTLVLLAEPACGRTSNSNRPQDIQTKLHSHITAYTLSADQFGKALIKIATKFDLPMGIEWVRSPETTRNIHLSWRNVTVQQVLQEIVEAQPGYKLEVSQGVVHVFAASMRSNPEDFLNEKIDKFEVHDQIVEVVSHRLRDIVRHRRPSPQPQSQKPAGVGYSQGANIGDPVFSLALTKVTVRDVLDQLALSSDRKVWVVTFMPGSPAASTGYRRTATLWNNNPVPDSEQPVWDMFRWSDSIP
ncbi:MAG: hypothetical protein ACYDHE_14830 [Candidatus Acidiferrales bacterium]